MEEAKKLGELYDAMKQRAEKKFDAERLDFLNLESITKVAPAALMVFGIAVFSTILIFVLVGRKSAQQRYQKIRKTFFVPPTWFGLGCGLSAWQNLHAFTTAIVFLKGASLSSNADDVLKQINEDYFSWGIYAINTFWVLLFAVTMAFPIDLGYAVVAGLFSIGTSFLHAATMTESLSIAGYLGLINVLVAAFWLVGVGKGWFKTEMQQAMKEIEGWGVPKGMTAAFGNNAKQRRPAGPRRAANKQ